MSFAQSGKNLTVTILLLYSLKMTRLRLKLFLLVVVTLTSTLSYAQQGVGNFQLQKIASGVREPVAIESSADGTGRLFLIQQDGKIRILTADGQLLQDPFLNVTKLIPPGAQRATQYETGLLGLVFHPDYETNGRFFIYYTDRSLAVVLKEFKVSAEDPNKADPHSGRTLIRVPHPTYFNHFGGQMEFGADGYLYVAFADGGGIGDPFKTAQNKRSFLGKIIRIDVNNSDGARYGVPSDNPFVEDRKYRPEIWALGFRNPWRFSFDSVTGRMFTGDVGQHRIEEINIVEKGKNYGWNIMEGTGCFAPLFSSIPDCNKKGLELPIHQYYHPFPPDGFATNAVIGGFVYRGSQIPELYGKYIFADFTHGKIMTLEENTETGNWRRGYAFKGLKFIITTFGEDDQGELYVTAFDKRAIYKIVPTTPAP